MDFSNCVIFSSIRFGAGGGFHEVFFLYSCLMYSESVDMLLDVMKCFVVIEFAILRIVLLMLFCSWRKARP
jgi:hypothetical protein